jgi:hypothetical protein
MKAPSFFFCKEVPLRHALGLALLFLLSVSAAAFVCRFAGKIWRRPADRVKSIIGHQLRDTEVRSGFSARRARPEQKKPFICTPIIRPA